ncbi:MAG: hypothetical protein QXD62_00870 [Candidatus Woesearchaeota archaeon]
MKGEEKINNFESNNKLDKLDKNSIDILKDFTSLMKKYGFSITDLENILDKFKELSEIAKKITKKNKNLSLEEVVTELSNIAQVIDLMKKYDLEIIDLENIVNIALLSEREVPNISIPGKKFLYLYFSDAHIGNVGFSEGLFKKMIKAIRQYKPDFVVFCGDLVEYPKSKEEFSEINYISSKKLIEYVSNLLQEIDMNIYAINGERDMLFNQKYEETLNLEKSLMENTKNYHFLGDLEGSLIINDSIKIMLAHPKDQPAYTTSYKLQKLIASLRGGEKPHILHLGHYHQVLRYQARSVEGILSGTLCGQTLYMKNKKIPAAMGFGIVKVKYSGKHIEEISHTFIPHYKD